ncbi:helix-turn-helix transcriptional regulator [Halorubrum sp. AS12]|uniref:helix-turn-helix transcriptional regulator n=1 Tax=Halorubrum sp. AS12 TaxID=3409687 RepID=UPI003DA71451
MSRRDRTTVSIAVLVVACCLAAIAVAAPAGAQSAAVPQTDDQPAPDNTITRIDLAADGSATWEITLRTRLENDSDVTEYERFQERFRANTSRYLDPFAERMSGVVAAANGSSDREMRATDFEAETGIQEVPRRWGVVSFRFTWTGFAAVDGDAVVVGDVFAGGFFIDDDDALAVSAPDGYAVESVAPEPDDAGDGTVEWRGREDFDDGRPSLRAAPTTTGDGGGEGEDDGGEGAGGGADAGGTENVVPLAALGALLVAAIGLGAYAVRSGRLDRDGPKAADESLAGEPGPGGDAGRTDDDASPNGGSSADAASTDERNAVDPELLTDEDRIRRALRERGGRMKQSEVVEAFGWSKSKTSRVLSRMADNGEVEKLRIGRENVIDLVEDEE